MTGTGVRVVDCTSCEGIEVAVWEIGVCVSVVSMLTSVWDGEGVIVERVESVKGCEPHELLIIMNRAIIAIQ